eukprot:NODE_1017_length_2632_cov_0.457165.p2 type:complete len:336 gc:universal NODE_1017_length_2632_cov_0.457165:417-1424(+)
MKTVLVTGGSSFISQHIIKLLLDTTAFNVVCTIRQESNRTQILKSWSVLFPSRLIIEKSELDQLESLKDILKNVDYVMHVASPFIMTSNKDEVVTPALLMTKTVLEACLQSKKVAKVIFTSSSITMSQIISKEPIHEKMYSTSNSLSPYEASKVESEKFIWEFVQEHDPKFECVSIHPSAVVGPGFSPHVVSSSVKSFIIDVLNGKSLPFQTQLDILMVDVRDVALAHILAIEKGQGRYLCCAESVPLAKIVAIAKKLEDFPNAPTMYVPPIFVQGLSYFVEENTSKFLRGHVGKGEYKFDNSKIIKDFGLKFMDMEKSITETIEWCIESQLFIK